MLLKLGRRRNAVRGPGMSRSTRAWRKAAYPNRLGSRVSGRLTSQRARHAQAKGNAGRWFSLCRSALKSGLLSQLYVLSFSPISCELRWQGEGCDPAGSKGVWPLVSGKETLMLWASSQNMMIGPMEGEAIDVSGS
ncbi:hypothetical protein L207DRAFT_266927 [Hyaloscypha variabilis F]|uniref:Uncharacterized protein n=1 Tax=Hyaloscypha variabilis (strain UAMH 11265 / GT02V1 / F) TaxID=1149755 RepID=A0A2J6RZD8_HYAVF|nr:hypothetical protein L207DRAFT_266927 [Hyaloscypha variabilis F]